MTTIQINDKTFAIYFKKDRYFNGQLKLLAMDAIDHSTLFELTKRVELDEAHNLIVCRDTICEVAVCSQLINNNVFGLEYSIDYSNEKLHIVNFK